MKQTLNTSAPVTADSPKGQRATETFRAQYNKAGTRRRQRTDPERAPWLRRILAHWAPSLLTKASDYTLTQIHPRRGFHHAGGSRQGSPEHRLH